MKLSPHGFRAGENVLFDAGRILRHYVADIDDILCAKPQLMIEYFAAALIPAKPKQHYFFMQRASSLLVSHTTLIFSRPLSGIDKYACMLLAFIS